MNGRDRIVERRQAERARVVGSAIVLTKDRYVGTFLLENVSADGALLAGDSEVSVGEQVRVMLQVHGSPRIGVRGKIARHAERDGQHVFALSFKAPPAMRRSCGKRVRHARSLVTCRRFSGTYQVV